jgi:hypothetical protein
VLAAVRKHADARDKPGQDDLILIRTTRRAPPTSLIRMSGYRRWDGHYLDGKPPSTSTACTRITTTNKPCGLRNMKVNRGGLISCGIYAAYSLSMFAIGYFQFPNNLKGGWFFNQLAIAPSGMLLTYTGLIGPLMGAFPWMNNLYFGFALSLAIMYLIGWGFSRLKSWADEENTRLDHRDPI